MRSTILLNLNYIVKAMFIPKNDVVNQEDRLIIVMRDADPFTITGVDARLYFDMIESKLSKLDIDKYIILEGEKD